MKYTNSYFQLNIRENGVYLHVYPEKDGGKKLNIQEIVAYLDKCGVSGYDAAELNRNLSVIKEEKDVFVSPEKISEVDEMAEIRVTPDRMMAVIRFYAPSVNGKYMTEKDILNELKRVNISYGVAEKVIRAYLAGRQF